VAAADQEEGSFESSDSVAEGVVGTVHWDNKFSSKTGIGRLAAYVNIQEQPLAWEWRKKYLLAW
jgi:hypothetical protein